MLEPYARLLGTTVTGLWQLAAVSDDGVIPLPGELVLETDAGFVSLSYRQDGLACTGPVDRADVRWGTEPWLTMGRADADEWLELVPAAVPGLPLAVTGVTGWFGVGDWVLPCALVLSGAGDPLVLMTTADHDLVRTDHRTAREHAEHLTAVMRMRLVEQRL
ncbi:hypothetical protein [Actinophytocola sp. KF-1]